MSNLPRKEYDILAYHGDPNLFGSGATPLAGPPSNLVLAAVRRAIPRNVGKLGVINIGGDIVHHDGMWGGVAVSVDTIMADLSSMVNNSDIDAILLNIDSYGGEVSGLADAHAAIMNARLTKPVYALANSHAFSAAYYLASAASKVFSISGGQVGSIGVLIAHYDYSEYLKVAGIKTTYVYAGEKKVEGAAEFPLSETARKKYQEIVDDYYLRFVNAVAAGRGVAASKVRKEWANGDIYLDNDALSMGMIDGVLSISDILQNGGSSKRTIHAKRMELERIK